MSYLKPCPFCGGEAEVMRNDIGVFIGCFHEDCPLGPATSTYVDGYSTEAEAVEAWNARAACGKCTERQGHYLDAETIERQQARIAQMQREADEALGMLTNQAATIYAQLRGIEERDELIRDLWPRASFTMGEANRESWMERMRDMGIDLEGVDS